LATPDYNEPPSHEDGKRNLNRLARFQTLFTELGFEPEELCRWMNLPEDEYILLQQEIKATLSGDVVPSILLMSVVEQLLNQIKRLEVENAGLVWRTDRGSHRATIKKTVVEIATTPGGRWQILVHKGPGVDLDWGFAHHDLDVQKRKAALYADHAIEDGIRRELRKSRKST
jgi:hypothetical protein